MKFLASFLAAMIFIGAPTHAQSKTPKPATPRPQKTAKPKTPAPKPTAKPTKTAPDANDANALGPVISDPKPAPTTAATSSDNTVSAPVAEAKEGGDKTLWLAGATLLAIACTAGGFCFGKGQPTPKRGAVAAAARPTRASDAAPKSVPAKATKLAAISPELANTKFLSVLREHIARANGHPNVRQDPLLSETLGLGFLVLQGEEEGAGGHAAAREATWSQIDDGRATLLKRALAEADPHGLSKFNANDLHATLQTMLRLDALARGVPLPAASSKMRPPLAAQAAQNVANWAQGLAENSGELGALEAQIKRLQDGLARAQKDAKSDASEISALNREVEDLKRTHASEREKSRQQRLDDLENLTREHQSLVAELAKEIERLDGEHKAMSVRLATERAAGADEKAGELRDPIEQWKRFVKFAGQQQGELEVATRAALERLHAASGNPALVGGVGFLMEHCLTQLSQSVHLGQAARREMALHELYALGQGFGGLPAFKHLAQLALKFAPQAAAPLAESKMRNAVPRPDSILFGVVLNTIRRESAARQNEWGEFPRIFHYDLDSDGAALRVVSDR